MPNTKEDTNTTHAGQKTNIVKRGRIIRQTPGRIAIETRNVLREGSNRTANAKAYINRNVLREGSIHNAYGK